MPDMICFTSVGLGVHADVTEERAADAVLREETRSLETLNRTGAALAADLDLERLVQMVTDATTELTGARFGAYFHNATDETGERLHLYTLPVPTAPPSRAWAGPAPHRSSATRA